jgi:hypothetical protein
MIHRIILLAVVISFTGCATGITEHSGEIDQGIPLKACYEVAMPSFIYQARCADLSSKLFGDSTTCTGIQAFDSSRTYWNFRESIHYRFPSSWEEYEKNMDYWNPKLFLRLLLEEQREAIAPIQTGTKIKVTGIYEYPRGERGHVLIVRATIDSGPHKGAEIELKTPGGFTDNGPTWVPQYFYKEGKPLEVNERYLRECM